MKRLILLLVSTLFVMFNVSCSKSQSPLPTGPSSSATTVFTGSYFVPMPSQNLYYSITGLAGLNNISMTLQILAEPMTYPVPSTEITMGSLVNIVLPFGLVNPQGTLPSGTPVTLIVNHVDLGISGSVTAMVSDDSTGCCPPAPRIIIPSADGPVTAAIINNGVTLASYAGMLPVTLSSTIP